MEKFDSKKILDTYNDQKKTGLSTKGQKILVLLVGPPGSGKSTIAQEFVNSQFVRVSQDDQGKKYLERFQSAIENEEPIVVDRMNFNKEQRRRFIKPAKDAGYQVFCLTLYIPKEICKERALSRENHPTIKDEKNFQDAHDTFMRFFEFPTEDEGIDIIKNKPFLANYKKYAVICDIDGTIANLEHRRHHVDKMWNQFKGTKPNWSAFFKEMEADTVYPEVEYLLDALVTRGGCDIIMCSGRPESYKEITKKWLEENSIPHDRLLMRNRKDHRDDALIKKIIYKFEIEPLYEVRFCLDDRQRVVDMWRELGLNVMQVRPGDF